MQLRKTHKHFCCDCGCMIIEGPMDCPEYDNRDHVYGRCDNCRGKS